jgi:hypothetical protein
VLGVAVPVSLHHEPRGQARGNQGGMMLVPLALGEPDPVRRLAAIAVETAARKPQTRPERSRCGWQPPEETERADPPGPRRPGAVYAPG